MLYHYYTSIFEHFEKNDGIWSKKAEYYSAEKTQFRFKL